MKKIIYYLCTAIFLFAGCKKEYLLQKPTSAGYGDLLTIAEAKKHFEKKFPIPRKIVKIASVDAPPDSEEPPEPIETFEDLVNNKIALWNSAFEVELASGQLVSVPLDATQDGYVLVNGQDIVPFSSLNYVHMYKDTNNEIQTYWVTYVPTDAWLYGERATYSGLAIVRNWNGTVLRVDNYQNGTISNSSMSDLTSVCLVFDNGYRSPITGKKEHCDGCIVTICATIPPPCLYCVDPPEPPGPSGPGGQGPAPGGIGGGGGGTPNTPPPIGCNSDPNYVVPSYPAPEGLDWIMPCSGGPTEVPYPETPTEIEYQINLLSNLLAVHIGGLTPEQETFLFNANGAVVYYFFNFLNTNNNLQRTEFVQWSISQLTTGNYTWGDYSRWFVTGYSEVFAENISKLSTAEWLTYVDINSQLTPDDYEDEFTKPTNEGFAAYLAFGDMPNVVETQFNGPGPILMPSLQVALMNAEQIHKTKINYLLYRKHFPEWGEAKCFWEAIRETLQTSLDAGGMIPLIGEVCDLTNGVIYTVYGEKLNATLSYAGAVPILGWGATGAKYAIKATSTLNRKILTWTVLADGSIDFGKNSGLLRQVLGITDKALQAHHIIPWADLFKNHYIVQRAAMSSNAFHLNEALNGIAVAAWRNQPNHFAYSATIYRKLEALPANITPNQAYDALMNIINDAKQAILANPNVHLNDLVF